MKAVLNAALGVVQQAYPTASYQADPEHGEFRQGTILITIHEACNLPNMDVDISGSGNLTDAYVRVLVDGRKSLRTKCILDSLNPRWEETLRIPVAGKVATITLHVKDEDYMGKTDKIGEVNLNFRDILSGLCVDKWYKIVGIGEGQLRATLIFEDANQLRDLTEVKSHFEERKGCRVTLYQDAHVGSYCRLPAVQIQSGTYNKDNNCWEHLYQGIKDARFFIYITGWSVWCHLFMLRERPLGPEGYISLGDLLKQKAEEGVRVCLLVWDEVLSREDGLMKGMMGTHDEETRAFFKRSKVNCELVVRHGRPGGATAGAIPVYSKLLGLTATSAMFTHHQKSVIFDAPSHDPSRRRVVAFVGGLDLTTGRYDTPEHSIFSTLNSYHANDYYQGYAGAYQPAFGPREPWHDIHSRVEGPVARDVMKNFEERWRKQVSKNELLVDLLNLPILNEREDVFMGYGSWNCQFFRSIDSHSAILVEQGVDKSIHEAYIHQIRRAEHFIYIENQYFLGSSQYWEGFDESKWNVECKHRIPIEIATKIVSKIRKNERFAVYVVIPMHPEGVPESDAVQAILFWQFKTVQMMYRKIQEAIDEMRIPLLVTDYLNFYCLGQREQRPNSHEKKSVPDKRQSNQLISQRHMIYVHSKMMIVDDEYIICGSANINERSMAGDRDTEMAIGAYQPDFVKRGPQLPGGEVAGFRLSLWAEHTKCYEPIFHQPHSLDCIHRINQIADYNWSIYDCPEFQPLPGHLMKYPYCISSRGEVDYSREYFPDMEYCKAKVKGAPTSTVPNFLTT